MMRLCSIRIIKRRRQAGFSILETMIACFILLVGVTGLMALFTVAVVRNTNQGDQATRTTEYAQDKVEELMAKDYADLSVTTGSTEYLDPNNAGTPTTTATASSFYTRTWKVEETVAGQVKTITVTVTAKKTVSQLAPSTTLICRKANVTFQTP